MAKRLLPLVLVVVFAIPAAAQTGPPSDVATATAAQSSHMRAGIAHYEKAFFELTPQKRVAEAKAEFDLAIASFEREVAANPAPADAHRYLGRILALQGEGKKAGEHFDKLAALEPFNVDACVLAALAYLDANEPAEARLRLEEGKNRTLDPIVLARLDGYIAKVDALKR